MYKKKRDDNMITIILTTIITLIRVIIIILTTIIKLIKIIVKVIIIITIRPWRQLD